MTEQPQYLHALCIAEALHLNQIQQLLENSGWQCDRLLDQALHSHHEGTDYFIFQNGAIITWSKLLDQYHYLPDLKNFARKPYAIIDPENFEVSMSTQSQIKGNRVTLAKTERDDKLAISYALSEAVKVNQYEKQLDKLADNLKSVTANLEQHGKISLSGRAVLKKMGAIFIVRSAINLHSDLLDTPDFFWDRPTLEVIYEQALQELDLVSRIQTLNERLNTMQDLYSLLSSQLEYRHGFMLESTIIVLITIEIITTVLLSSWGHLH